MNTDPTAHRSVETAAFREARDALHAGAILLASVADSLCPPRDDDSQSNLGVVASSGAFVSRDLRAGGRVRLVAASLSLEWEQAEGAAGQFSLHGLRFDEALARVEDALGASMERRTFPDLPANAVLDGGLFPPGDPAAREAVFSWYAEANSVTEALRGDAPGLGEVRVWPHHFDLGALVAVDPPDRVIGLGMSPGDATLPDPYYYCSPYPQPASSAALPELPVGEWLRETQTVAVLPATTRNASEHPRECAARFLRGAVAACRTLLA